MTTSPRASVVMKLGSPLREAMCAEGVGPSPERSPCDDPFRTTATALLGKVSLPKSPSSRSLCGRLYRLNQAPFNQVCIRNLRFVYSDSGILTRTRTDQSPLPQRSRRDVHRCDTRF